MAKKWYVSLFVFGKTGMSFALSRVKWWFSENLEVHFLVSNGTWILSAQIWTARSAVETWNQMKHFFGYIFYFYVLRVK